MFTSDDVFFTTVQVSFTVLRRFSARRIHSSLDGHNVYLKNKNSVLCFIFRVSI